MWNEDTERQAITVLKNIPNIILAIIAVLVIGFEFGWDSLLKLPFNLLVIILLYTTIVAFVWRIREMKDEESKRVNEVEELKKNMREVNEPIITTIQELINEIRQDRNERRNNKRVKRESRITPKGVFLLSGHRRGRLL